MYADDDTHPIPSIDNLDILAELRGGGAKLVIVIATPLQADERSQRRLLKKIENYLEYISSPEFKNEFGAPDPSRVSIVVKIHKQSDPVVFDLLKRCEPWALQNKATLTFDTDLNNFHQ